MNGFLLDENVDPEIRDQLIATQPGLQVYVIGDEGVPRKSTSDPAILLWIETYDCMLVTYNYSSMPVHLRDHLAQGHHVPGIIRLSRRMSIGAILEDLRLIWGASLLDEYRDRIVYLPL